MEGCSEGIGEHLQVCERALASPVWVDSSSKSGVEVVDGFANWTRVRAGGTVLGTKEGVMASVSGPWQCRQLTHLRMCIGGLSWERLAGRGGFGDGPG